MAPSLSVLARNRDFRYLFFAECVVFGGDWFALIPLITLLNSLTGSGLPGALALAADTAVGALVLPLAGAFADRFDRRRLMIVSNVATIGAIGALLLVRSDATAWIGPVGIGLAAAAKAFYSPAAGAALPNLVGKEDLGAANALGGSAWGTMLVVGASLGGIVNALVGPYWCFAITVVCLTASAVLVTRVRARMQEEGDRSATRPVRAIIEALRYIRAHPRVASLVTVKSAVGLGNGVLAVFPLLSTVVFPVGSVGTGLLFAARGVGVLIGPPLFRRWLAPQRLMGALALSMVAYGLAYLGVAFSPWFWLALVLVVVAHMAGGGNWMLSAYALQLEVPDALRGRVVATDTMLATLAISVSTLLAGAMVDHVDPRIPIAVCAGLTLIYGVVWRAITLRTSSTVVISPR